MSIMRLFTFILSIFIVGMVEMMVAGIMNLMSQDLHVSEAVVGQLVTMYALTFAICGPILVKLTNRFSSRPVLLWTLLIFIIGNGIIAVAPNFSILVVGRIISSAAAALIIVKVLAITAMLSAPKNRGKILPKDQEIQRGSVNHEAPSHENHVTSKILRPAEVAKYLIITFLVLIANSVTFVFINPLILSNGHDMSFVSLALLVNGIAGVIGTSLGGIFSDKITSKRWLMISVSIFIVMMLLMNLILPGSGLLLAGLFIWNIMQWSTNPAVQSGVIQHVEGDTSQVMSWNMSSLNAGIGVGGIIGGLVMTHVSVQAITYTSAIIGALGLIVVLTLKNNHYAKTFKSS